MKLFLFSLTCVLYVSWLDAEFSKISYSDWTQRSKGDFNSIGSLVKMYQINNDFYPTQEQGLRALVEKPERFPATKKWTQLADRIPIDHWGNPYQYIAPTSPQGQFGLYSMGRDGISKSMGNDPDDFNSWSNNVPQPFWTDGFRKNIFLIAGYAFLFFASVRWILSQCKRRKLTI